MDDFIAHILVVDDDDGIRSLVKKYLNENKFLVTTAENAENALEKLQIIKFDLIVLDIMMPGMDGYEICQQLKQDPEFVNTPVIFLTGKDRSDDMGRSFKSGGDMFIKKPFSCERLLEIVNIVMMSTGNM